MIIFDQERLSAFFDTVSRGFERSPLEIILVIVAVAAFLALLITASAIQRRKIRQKRSQLADARFRELAEKRDLDPAEQELVQRMARFLKEPLKKYLILINQPTFNYCAARLRDKETGSEAALAGLRHKLGFRIQGPEQVPASSAELPERQGLLILGLGSRQGLKAQGRIVGQEAGGLVVELIGAASGLKEGDPVRVYFQNRSGLFSFQSRVQSAGAQTLRLQHGDEIKRTQRRKYYRKKISRTVAVSSPGSEDKPYVSMFYDLGGNGASLKNPGKRFGQGDDVELTFFTAGERFTLVAEVLRTSRGGEVLHVRFAPMRESTRDRIIGSLFKGAVP